MRESIVYDKSLNFAERIVNLYKYMIDVKSETVMSKQLLRCGTSIGANISEALAAESSADFIHKLSISQKEINETIFWLELMRRTKYLSYEQTDSMMTDCNELKKMISSIILTTKQNLKPNKL
jgi:four helix bundle protein